MNNEVKQLVCLVVLFVLAIFAASSGRWDIVSGVITGIFALLNFRGDSNEKPVDSVTDGPVTSA